MVNGKNVKFRESSCEKSPSPKRFEEPEGMTDIDLRRLSEISGYSDCSMRRFDPKSVKKKLCKLLFIMISIVLGFVIIFLVLSSRGVHPWRIFQSNPYGMERRDDLAKVVAYYMNKLDRCKALKSLETCCAIFSHGQLEDCTVDKILDAISKHELNMPENALSDLSDYNIYQILQPSPVFGDYDYPDMNYEFAEFIETDPMPDFRPNDLIPIVHHNDKKSISEAENGIQTTVTVAKIPTPKVAGKDLQLEFKNAAINIQIDKTNKVKRETPIYHPHLPANEPREPGFQQPVAYPLLSHRDNNYFSPRNIPDTFAHYGNTPPIRYINSPKNINRPGYNHQQYGDVPSNIPRAPLKNDYHPGYMPQHINIQPVQSRTYNAPQANRNIVGHVAEVNIPQNQNTEHQPIPNMAKINPIHNLPHVKPPDMEVTHTQSKISSDVSTEPIRKYNQSPSNNTEEVAMVHETSEELLQRYNTSKIATTTEEQEPLSTTIIELDLLNPEEDPKLGLNPESKVAQFASEDIQSSQHTSVNPIFNQRQCIASYTPPLGSSLPLLQQQVPFSYDPNTRYAQLLPIPVQRGQANSYVINPQYTYVTPGLQQIPSYPLYGQNMINTNTLQTSSPGGQYYICNPLPTGVQNPSNNHIAGMSGVEVRESEFQQILASPLHDKGLTRESEYCAEGQEMCADGSKCLHKMHVCDGEVHCNDGSDELYCSCKYRIGPNRICDGYYDCPNGEDEIGCFGCSPQTFNCDDWSYRKVATCIPMHQRCDGVPNCATGKDEQDCSALLDSVESSEDAWKVSLNAGFLHRNFKGKWYPACANPEVWALDACKDEAGPSVLPPLTQTIPIDYKYKGAYISALPQRHVEIVDSCFAERAVYVECPQPTCGMRKVARNPYRPEEVDTSAEEIAARFRPARAANESLLGGGRVVGGKACQPGSWPWVVSIYKNGLFHCGGVLVSDHWLVTAAHCVEKYWQYYYEIELGMLRRFSYSPMQQTRYVTHVIPHAAYDRANLKNDLALMRMHAPVKYNRYVRPICLPTEFTAGMSYAKGPLPGTVCTAVGWGATVEHGADPDHMREVEVPVLPICKHKEDAEGNEICAGLLEGGKDACQGDSGGPFLCKNPNIPNQWYLAGIVSHGEGCARPDEPGVYTRIAIYRDWIYEHAKDDMLPARTPLHHCPGYMCKTIKKCIPKKRRCDKIVDCLYGDDEMECDKVNPISSLFKHAMRHMMLGHEELSRTNEETSEKTREEVGTTGDSISETTFKMENSPITDAVNRNGFAKDDTSFASPAQISDQNKFISNTGAARADVTAAGVDESSPASTILNASTAKSNINSTVMIKPFKGERFLCTKMLEIIPLAKKCDKVIDCQDGTDEESCDCADYLRNSHPEAICDGITDCRDLSDEKDCGSCSEDYFYCRLSKTCIPLEKKCNNKADCKFNEDEWDCFALTDKYHIELDSEARPKLNVRGVLALNHKGNWRPMCGNFSRMEATISADVCLSLGFSDYENFQKLVVTNTTLKITNGNDTLTVPAGNETCNGIYIKCSNVTTGTHQIGDEDRLNAANEMHTSPWNAAVYADSEYKCTGTILNLNWILTSVNCFPGILKLNQHYVSALLGVGRGHLNVGGPHEQIIPIVESVRVSNSDAVLLRLREEITFTRYVRPLNFQRKSDFIRYKETCVAMGTDLNQTSRAVLLKPVQNCTTGFRCFKRLDTLPAECEISNYTNAWSGCVVCDSGNGFYPAAIFHQLRGECGFSRGLSLISISNFKREIYQIMNTPAFNVDPPICPGFRCNLGKCIDMEKLCDGIPDCRDEADEESGVCEKMKRDCHLTGTCVCGVAEMQCANSKCVPKTKFCDQVDDCGDGSDEPDKCDCQGYLRLADPDKICDGTRNCLDRTDENPEICKCNAGQFKCGLSSNCIPSDMVCDGYKDCPLNEDESHCIGIESPDDNHNVGEVKTRTAGVWHSGCWPQNLTTTELEDICKALGFTGTSASVWNTNGDNASSNRTVARPMIDVFSFVWIHRNTDIKVKLGLRSGKKPYVHFVDDPRCYKLFIQCL